MEGPSDVAEERGRGRGKCWPSYVLCFSWPLTTLISCDARLSFLPLCCPSCFFSCTRVVVKPKEARRARGATSAPPEQDPKMSRHETFLKEKKGRSARLSPATKFGRAVWVVEGAGGAYQPKIWPCSHPALRRPKAPLFATSAKRSPNALPARGQMERERGKEPSHRGPRPAPAPRSRPRRVLRQEDRRGVSSNSFFRRS